MEGRKLYLVNAVSFDIDSKESMGFGENEQQKPWTVLDETNLSDDGGILFRGRAEKEMHFGRSDCKSSKTLKPGGCWG